MFHSLDVLSELLCGSARVVSVSYLIITLLLDCLNNQYGTERKTMMRSLLRMMHQELQHGHKEDQATLSLIPSKTSTI